MAQNVNRVCIKAGTEGKTRLMLPFVYAESSGLMQKFTTHCWALVARRVC